MVRDDTEWRREASLLRPAALTKAIFADGRAPDPSLPWVPETMLPLYGSESLAALSHAQRLRYNHIYARQLLDEFVWLEQSLIRPPLRRLLDAQESDTDTSLILRSFVSDESNHIECFSTLAALAVAVEPPPPTNAILPLFRPPLLVRVLASVAVRFPVRLSFWNAVVAPLEELATKIGQTYMRDKTVDPLFRDVFVAHARDEARHCRLDDLFAAWLCASATEPWKRLNNRLAAIFDSAYRSTDWGLEGPIRELAHAYPEIIDRTDVLIAESKAARSELIYALDDQTQ